jgi:hypothetical protein
MSKLYSFEKQYLDKGKSIKVKLFLIHFVDEKNIHYIYSPHLDLTGYGLTEEEAKQSFDIALYEFLDYTIKKKTLGKVLEKLGWKIKGSNKHPKKLIKTKLDDVLKNSYVTEIFNKYHTETFHQQVYIPQL